MEFHAAHLTDYLLTETRYILVQWLAKLQNFDDHFLYQQFLLKTLNSIGKNQLFLTFFGYLKFEAIYFLKFGLNFVDSVLIQI